jgi:hypothetical protein
MAMTEQRAQWRVEDRQDIPVLLAPDGREYALNFDVSQGMIEAVALAAERAAQLVAAVNQAPLVEELVGALEAEQRARRRAVAMLVDSGAVDGGELRQVGEQTERVLLRVRAPTGARPGDYSKEETQ